MQKNTAPELNAANSKNTGMRINHNANAGEIGNTAKPVQKILVQGEIGNNDEFFAKLWKNEPYGTQNISKELVEKRDAYAKHFANEDGSISAHIASGPIHYKEKDEWKTIFHTISPTANGFENIHNSHKTYYPASATESLTTVLENGEVLRDMINMNMYFSVNGEKVHLKTIQDNKGRADFNQLTYPNAYGNGIDLQLTHETTKRKMDYVIHNREAIGDIPNNASHLVFEETIELPIGWKAELKDNIIYIKDGKGEIQVLYEKPFLEDSPNFDKLPKENITEKDSKDLKSEDIRKINLRDEGEYSIKQNGRLLTIQTAVTIEWITSKEREFPVKVDPTVNVSPNNATNWTRSTYSSTLGYASTLRFGIIKSGQYAYWVKTHIKFNLQTIPTNITVNSVTGYINVNNYFNRWEGKWQFANSADPTTATNSQILHNSINLGYSNIVSVGNSYGWKSSLLMNPEGNQYIYNAIVNGSVNVGVAPSGTYYYGQYYVMDGHASANKPYLIVDYSYRLNVSNAYTGASYPNGANVPPQNGPVNITPGTRPGYVCVGWNSGTGDIPATGTANSFNISGGLTQSSAINWLWEVGIGRPNNVIFYNFGGSEQLAFNNSRVSTTTPVFRMSHSSSDATDYQVEISTNSTFASGATWTQTFTGTYPLNTETNFTFNNSFAPVNETTYYVRAKVKGAAGVYSSWSTETYSFTYKTGVTIPEWYQTAQPQFLTDALIGTVATATNDVIANGNSNPFKNPSFEFADASDLPIDWNRYGNSWVKSIQDDDYMSDGSWSLAMYIRQIDLQSFGGYDSSNDNLSVYQNNVDLTGVTELNFELWQWYIYGYGSNAPVSFQVIIDDNSSDGDHSSGTVIYEKMSVNTQELIYGTQTVDLTPYNFSGNKTIKLIYKVNYSDNGNFNAYIFYVDNLRLTKASSGTITSTPVHLASIQEAIGYEELEWNQTLNGGDMIMKVQQSANGISGWTDVAGYDNISATGPGMKTHDLSAMQAYDHVRLVGFLNGENVILHDWAIKFKKENVLPVSLLYFNVSCKDNIKTLNWATASEINNDVFIIQSSSDATNFAEIGRVTGAGNSNQLINYSFSDENSLAENAYYRILQRDFDGQEKVYGPVSSNCEDGIQEFNLFPNPNKGNFQIVLTSLEEKPAKLLIYDTQGRIVFQKDLHIEKGNNWIEIELNVCMGIYSVRILDEENAYKTQKIIVN